MIGVWMTPCKNGQCEISVRRDGINKIIIGTQTPLNDEQAEELFWIVSSMIRSGETLHKLLKEQPEIVRCKDCKYATLTTRGECEYCEMDTDDEGYPRLKYRSGDWFCADGERKEKQ